MPDLAAVLTELQVLVVDDDDFFLEVTSELLRSLGVATVHRAHDGAEAMRVVASNPAPDIILCDLEMEGIDGIALMRLLAEGSFAGAVIVMSGFDDALIRSVASLVREHGLLLAGTLPKPFGRDDLLFAMRRAASLGRTVRGRQTAAAGPKLDAAGIRYGLEHGRIGIAAQPQIRTDDRRVVGAEVLLRWYDPEFGMLPPGQVVAAAVASGLIDELTIDVFTLAVRWLADRRAEGADITVSMNLSTENLLNLDLPARLVAIAEDTRIDPAQVVLEVTESHLLSDLTLGLEVLGRLRLCGFGLAIDDFGTGYSSLEKLRQLPLTELKIDGSFVDGARTDPVKQTILSTTVELGRALGLTVVAEGVETLLDWELLARIGCDRAQGYFVSRPLSSTEFTTWSMLWNERTIGVL